jgi:hypothetical protein
MSESLTPQERRVLREAAVRASEQGWGVAVGALFGVGLFLATMILVIKGGPDTGAHLGMLGVYFPGYTVTWFGAFIGFVYAFVVGYAAGRTVATLYNKLAPQ